MKIQEVQNRNFLLNTLLVIWENSVKATHLFLSEKNIAEIKKYVPEALSKVEHLIIAENNKNEITAFMGIQNRRLEMLFLSPSERGKGIGNTIRVQCFP